MESETISKFANLGRDEVPADGTAAKTVIIDLLSGARGKWFPKKAFTDTLKGMEGVAQSNPAIHNALKKLTKEGTIECDATGKKHYYRMPEE